MYDSIESQIIAHEGERLKLYKCGAGKLTIGVGRNIEDNGIRKDESELMFRNDLNEAVTDLINFLGPSFWEAISEGRRRALTDLRFNLGPNRFRGFARMIRACRYGDWKMAAYELTDSLWWRQVQDSRKTLLYNQLLTGEP